MDSGQISTILLAVAGFVAYMTSQMQQRAKENRSEVRKLRRENGLLWRRNYHLATELDKRGIPRPPFADDWLEYFKEEEEPETKK